MAGFSILRVQRAISQDDLPLLASDRIVVERLVGPDSLDLHVERVATRRLPVAARVRGVPKTGWAWSGAALADPATVVVRGPHRAVAQLDSIRLLPVDVANRQDTVRTHVEADSLPPWCTIDGYLAARRRRHTGRLHDQLRRWQASGQQGGDTSPAAGAGRIEAGPVVRGGPELSTPRTCPNPRCPGSHLGLGSPGRPFDQS